MTERRIDVKPAYPMRANWDVAPVLDKTPIATSPLSITKAREAKHAAAPPFGSTVPLPDRNSKLRAPPRTQPAVQTTENARRGMAPNPMWESAESAFTKSPPTRAFMTQAKTPQVVGAKETGGNATPAPEVYTLKTAMNVRSKESWWQTALNTFGQLGKTTTSDVTANKAEDEKDKRENAGKTTDTRNTHEKPVQQTMMQDDDVESLVNYCLYLGADVNEHPELVPLVAQMFWQPLPDDWKSYTTDEESEHGPGYTYYWNSKTGRTQWVHPNEDEHVRILEKKVRKIIPGTRIWFHRNTEMRNSQIYTLFHEQTKHLPEKRPLLRSADESSDISEGVINCPLKDNFPQLHSTVITTFTSYFQIQQYDDVSMWGAFLIKLAAVCPIPPGWTFNYDEDLCEAVYVRGDHFCIKRHPMDAFFSAMLDVLFRRHFVWRMKGGDQQLRDYFNANDQAKAQSPRDEKAPAVPALNAGVMSSVSQESIPLAPATPTGPRPPDGDCPAVPVIPSHLKANGELALTCHFGDKRPKIPPRPPLIPSSEYNADRAQQDMALLRGHVGVKGVVMTSPPSLKADDKRTCRRDESEAGHKSPSRLSLPPPPLLRTLPQKDDNTAASGGAARAEISATSSEHTVGTAPQRQHVPPAATVEARMSGPEASKRSNSKDGKVHERSSTLLDVTEPAMRSVEQQRWRLPSPSTPLLPNDSPLSPPEEKRAFRETSPQPLTSSQQKHDYSRNVDALPGGQREKDPYPLGMSPPPPGGSERRKGSGPQSSTSGEKHAPPERSSLTAASSYQRRDEGQVRAIVRGGRDGCEQSSFSEEKYASAEPRSQSAASSHQRRSNGQARSSVQEERHGGAQKKTSGKENASAETLSQPVASSHQRGDHGQAQSNVQNEKNASCLEILPVPSSSSQRRERDGCAHTNIPRSKDAFPETHVVQSIVPEKNASPETSFLPSRGLQSQNGDGGVHSSFPQISDASSETSPLPPKNSDQRKFDDDTERGTLGESEGSPSDMASPAARRSQRRKEDSDARANTRHEKHAPRSETVPAPLSGALQSRNPSDVKLSGMPPLPLSGSQKCAGGGDVLPTALQAEDARRVETPLLCPRSSRKPHGGDAAHSSVPRKNSLPSAETLPPPPLSSLPSPPLTDTLRKRDEESLRSARDDLTSSHTTANGDADSHSRNNEKHTSRVTTSPIVLSPKTKPVARRQTINGEESSTALRKSTAQRAGSEMEHVHTPQSETLSAPELGFPVLSAPSAVSPSVDENMGVSSKERSRPPPAPADTLSTPSVTAERNASPKLSMRVVNTTVQKHNDDGWEKRRATPQMVEERESTSAQSHATIGDEKMKQKDRKTHVPLASVPAASIPPPVLSTSDTCQETSSTLEQPTAAQNEETRVVRDKVTAPPSAVAENRVVTASKNVPQAQNAAAASPPTTNAASTLNQQMTPHPSSSTAHETTPAKDQDADSVLALVLALTAQLRTAPDNEVLGILQNLKKVDMTVNILQESKVGVATQRFKTHKIPAVQECVKDLRQQWKNVILQKQKKHEGSHKMPAPEKSEPLLPLAADSADVDKKNAVPARPAIESKHQSTRVNSQGIKWLRRLFLEQREALYDVLVDRTDTEEADRIRGHLDVVRFHSLLTGAFEEGRYKPLQSFMKRFAGTTLTSTLCSVETGEKWWGTIVEKIDATKDVTAEDWVRKDLPRLLADIGQCLGEIRKAPVAKVPFTLPDRAASSTNRVSLSMNTQSPRLTPPPAPPPSSQGQPDAPFALPTSLPKRPQTKPGIPTSDPSAAHVRTPPTVAPVRKQPATASPISVLPTCAQQRLAAPPQVSPVVSTDEENEDSDVSLGGVARAMGLCEPHRMPQQGKDHASCSSRDTVPSPLIRTETQADDEVQTPPFPSTPHASIGVLPLDPELWGKLGAYAGGALDNLGSALEYYLPGAAICTRGSLQQMTDGELLVCQHMMDALTKEINQQLLASFKDRDELHSDIQHRNQYANMLYARAHKTAFTAGLI